MKRLITLLILTIITLAVTTKAQAEPLPLLPTLNVAFFTNEEVFYMGDPTPQPNDMSQEIVSTLCNATSTIDMAIYGLNYQPIADCLMAAHDSGVLVRIVAECDYLTHDSYGSYYQQLLDAGIPIVFDSNPLACNSSNGLMHSKFIVVDSQITVVSTANWTVTGLFYNLNNMLVFNDSDISGAYINEFDEMFVDGRFHGNKIGNGVDIFNYADGVVVEVYFTPSEGDEYVNLLVDLFGDSHTEDILISAFYLTLDEVGDALELQILDGVNINIIMDANGFSGSGSEGERLCDSDIDIKVEITGGKEHEKTFSVNRDTFGTGSPNFSNSARVRNDENFVLIRGMESITDEYISHFWRIYNELPDSAICQRRSAESGIVACDDANEWGGDNDHDEYIDWNGYMGANPDFDCSVDFDGNYRTESTVELCQNDIDDDLDGHADELDDDCFYINHLCPSKSPDWFPPQLDGNSVMFLEWTPLSGFVSGIEKPYNIYGSHNLANGYNLENQTFESGFTVDMIDDYQFYILTHGSCLERGDAVGYFNFDIYTVEQ